MSLFHPNVAVALSHAGLRVKKWHSDTPLRTEPSIVVMTLFHGVSVVLLSQPVIATNRARRRLVGRQTEKKHQCNHLLQRQCLCLCSLTPAALLL